MLGVGEAKKFVLPLRVLNSLLRAVEKRDKRSSRAIGGIVQCGGVQVDGRTVLGRRKLYLRWGVFQ